MFYNQNPGTMMGTAKLAGMGIPVNQSFYNT
jgi:uncharacterized protein (DUF433 family)